MTMIISGDNGLTFPNSTIQASAGSVLQVVNATYSTQASTTGNTYIATGLTASITPKFSTSKILVIVCQNGCYDGGSIYAGLNVSVLRGATTLISTVSMGNTGNGTSAHYMTPAHYTYLDSPATTSSTTYSTQFAMQSGGAGTVYVQNGGQTSTITLMEIAG